MAKYFCRISEMRGGFFDTAVHGEIGSPGCTIPEGAIALTDEGHAELTAPRTDNKLVYPDGDGYPVLMDPPPASDEELAADERVWRDASLAATDGVVSRHRDEVEAGAATTLTLAQYSALQQYRQALRNWPENGEFPLIDHRPVAPPWLAEQVQ